VKKHFTNLVGNLTCFFFFAVLTQGTFLKILEVFEDYYNQSIKEVVRLNYKFIIKLLHFLSVRLGLFIGIISKRETIKYYEEINKNSHFMELIGIK
jgi:hypothetical protein